MRVKENPFFILEVSPSDTLEVINSKYDEKAFLDEENEHLYDNARQILSSPAKRLSAEVRWFYNLDEPVSDIINTISDYEYRPQEAFENLEEEYSNPRENLLLNLEKLEFVPKDYVANFIIEIDSNYGDACDSDEIYELIDDINACRRKAKIALCKDFDAVKREVKDIINDIKDSLNLLLKRNDRDILEFTNEIAAKTIENGEEYGLVIEHLINLYANQFQSQLQNYKDKIFYEANENCLDITEEYELDELCDLTREFDYMAQPIQLLLEDRGQSNLQIESVEVADKIRDLAIYFYNEKNLPTLSIRLLNLEMELFSELPDFYSQLEEDKETLVKLTKEKQEVSRIHAQLDELDKNIIHDNKYVASNRRYLQQHINTIKNVIFEYINNNLTDVLSISDEKYKVNSLVAAVYFKNVGCACTWAEMWAEALEFYKKAWYWAPRTADKDLMANVYESLNDVQKTIDTQKQHEAKEAADREALNYEKEWGLILKERIKISHTGVEYNGTMIPLSSITGVLWGSVRIKGRSISSTEYNIKICSRIKTIQFKPPRGVYHDVVDRLWKGTASRIIMNILTALKNNQDAGFGRHFQDYGIHYEKTHWFSKNDNVFYPWNMIRMNSYNGELIFYNPKNDIIAEYSYLETYNTHFLEAIVDLAKRKGVKRLSDLL